MKAAVVLTTIHVPELLEGYRDNFERYGHLDDVTVYVIPDRKTPREANYCIESLRKRGLKVEFPDLGEQTVFLDSVGLPIDFVPCDSDQRRNVGYLMALAGGCEFMVSLDDDNFCIPHFDFLANHELGPRVNGCCTTGGWHNPCDALGFHPQTFARGFPYFARNGPSNHKMKPGIALVRANSGLWFGDPDIDAITWLAWPALSEPRETDTIESTILGPATWSPINSQNTCVARECIPSYLFLPAGRFGDIFQGYFLLACLKSQGYTARFGTPVVDHRRNSHDYLADAEDEIRWIRILEKWLPCHIERKLTGSSMTEAYECLADQEPMWRDKMLQWTKACKTIGV